MSRRPFKYVWWDALDETVQVLVAEKKLSRPRARVILAVATYRFMRSNNNGTNCYPGVRSIIRGMILDSEQVADGDRWLDENGWLFRLRNREDGLKSYRLTIPRDGVPGEPYTDDSDGVPGKPYTDDSDGVPAQSARCTGSPGTDQVKPEDDRDEVRPSSRSGPPNGSPPGTTKQGDHDDNPPGDPDPYDPSKISDPDCHEGPATPVASFSIFAGDPVAELARAQARALEGAS